MKFSIDPTASAWKISIMITISFENHSPINQTLIFIFQPRSLFSRVAHKTGTWKTPFSGVKRFRFFFPSARIINQRNDHTLIWIFQSTRLPLLKFFSSRSWSRLKIVSGSIKPWFEIFNQTLIFIFQPGFDWKVLGRPWFIFSKQGLIGNKLSRFDGKLSRFYVLLEDFVNGYWSGAPDPRIFLSLWSFFRWICPFKCYI